MTAVTEQIFAYFDLSSESGDYFTLDDLVLGELDGVGVLAGEIATDITSESFAYTINRGRSFELDQVEVGRAAIQLNNFQASFFPQVYNVTVGGDEELTTDGDETFTSDDDDEFTVPSEDVGYGTSDDNIKPGKRIQIVAEGVTIWDGAAEDWSFEYEAEGNDVSCSVTALDRLGQLALAEFDEWTTTDGDTSGERVIASLTRNEVDFPMASAVIDDGLSTLQDDLVTWGSNVLNYLQLVAQSELGRLYATRTNVLRFRGRDALAAPEVSVAFTDTEAAGSVPFRSISLDVASALVYTDVSVDRLGGTAQTVFDTAARDELRGIRRLSLGDLLLDSDEQSEDIATYLLNTYKSPALRVRSMVIRLDQLDAPDRVKVLSLDLGDVISIEWTPRGADGAMQRNCVVEGISHSASAAGPHDVTLSLSLVQSGVAFVLDSDVLGVLDESVLSF